MTLPSIEQLYAVCEATWPCATQSEAGGCIIRDGQGGGKRVSAATLNVPISKIDLKAAEAAMTALSQPLLFQVRAGETDLDRLLEAEGYQIVDPVNVWAASADSVATELPPRTVAIPAWEPLQIMREIWQAGGIGPARIEVMHRACTPKSGFVSRWQDKPAGTSFIAMHNGIAMVHALEIKADQRRNGLARWAMRRAAFWTLQNGGHCLSVICTQGNAAANGLYASLGMQNIGTYHYRIKA